MLNAITSKINQKAPPYNTEFVVLSLGSNLHNKLFYLRSALSCLPLNNIKTSSIYITEAMLTKNAPPSWQKQFYNMAVVGNLHKKISPGKMLQKIKQIELALGRKKEDKWAPRTIDIDIIFWGCQVIKTTNLTIPHPGLYQRDFVLIPIKEIMPNLISTKAINNCTTKHIIGKMPAILKPKL